jgi:hypothetical protein
MPPLDVLTFPPEAPFLCPNGEPPSPLRLRTRSPGGGGEPYVSNFEVLPNRYLFGVRNLTRHWRTDASNAEHMEYWYMEAARCAPRDDAVYDVWLRGDKEDEALSLADASRASRVYLVLQQAEDDSLLHMAFDVAIFFRYWAPLVTAFPRLQLLLRGGPMEATKKMLLRAYGVPEHRVEWRDLFAQGYSSPPATGFGENNLVFFPPNVCPQSGNVEETHEAFDALSAKLVADAGLPPRASCSSVPRGVVLVPKVSRRGLEHPLERFPSAVHAAVRALGGTVVNTSALSSISEQVALMGSARVVIIPTGSGFDWNALFMRGATVISVNPTGHAFHEYPAINDMLARFLTYNRLFVTNSEAEILDLLERAMRAPPLPCPMKVSYLRRHYPSALSGTFTHENYGTREPAVDMPPLSTYADQEP